MRYYKATFTDGRITKRGTDCRVYTHGWIIPGRNAHGFSSSERLAHGPNREVAPVEEITAAEYRNIRTRT